MGWYTDGPGEVRYKYGDVIAAAQATGVGELTACPRLEIDETFWLREKQRAALERGLPWKTLPLDADPSRSGAWMPVPRDVDARDLLDDLAENVWENASTLRELVGEAWPDEGYVSLDFDWGVEEEDYGALIAWINASPLAPALTLEALGSGRIESQWYKPPTELRRAFKRLAEEKSPRHLVACMLGAALVSGEALSLYQPGDDYQQAISLTARRRRKKRRRAGAAPGGV